MFGDEGLVQPAAGQVQAIGQPVHRAQLGGGAGGQAVMGRAWKAPRTRCPGSAPACACQVYCRPR